MSGLHIELCELDAACERLRVDVRAFLEDALPDHPGAERARGWFGLDPAFSRRLGAQGWIGMCWPARYGGAGRSALERYVVIEELLAAGAPVAAHWVADRQSGPQLIRHSPDVLAPRILPGIARGETYFCIGMSEPDCGSDLASVRTRATRSADGWVINGRKVWTSRADISHYMIALVRTGPPGPSRHEGLSQFVVDLATPGIHVRPIRNQAGEGDFCEVTFDDVVVPDECLLGNAGDGWQLVTGELAMERSGPERYLSSVQLLREMVGAAAPGDPRQAVALGRLIAGHATARQMSLGVAGMLARGEDPALAAAVVKDVGCKVEQSVPEIAHDQFGGRAAPGTSLDGVMRYLTLAAPSFSLRGGTREILRGIIARGLELR